MNLDYKTDYVFENEYLLLRPLVESDHANLLEYSINEPEIWTYNAWGANGSDNLKTYIENAVVQRRSEREFPFIVFDKLSRRYVGTTRFYDYQQQRKILQIGYTWYGKKYQGTHVNKCCKYLLLEFAFEQLGVERVGFGANSKNDRSINAMRGIGCVEEGILRNYSFGSRGERIDVIVFSILKNEWYTKIKGELGSRF